MTNRRFQFDVFIIICKRFAIVDEDIPGTTSVTYYNMAKHYIVIIWYYYINFAYYDKTNKKSDARVRITVTTIMVIMPNEYNTCVVLPTYDLSSCTTRYNNIFIVDMKCHLQSAVTDLKAFGRFAYTYRLRLLLLLYFVMF